MYTINRSIAIIRIKQPFVDWANQLPDAEFKSSLDDFKTDCLAILIPDYDTDEEAIGYINEIYEDIFLLKSFMDGVPKRRGFHRIEPMKCSGNGLG